MLSHEKESDAYSGSFVLFNSNSLKKCQSISKARQIKNLKYSDAKLPVSIELVMGYHMTCYRRFVAPSKEERGKMEKAEKLEGQSCENNVQNSKECIVPIRIMMSTIKSPKQSQSTRVFPKVSLFVNQARKRIKGKEQELSGAELKKKFW